MVEIIFQNKGDAKKFHQYLLLHLPPFYHKNDYLHFSEDRHIGRVKINKELTGLFASCKKVFFQFIIKIKLNDWFRMILKENYFYEDEAEQQQILDIIQSILEGKRIELSSFIKDPTLYYKLEKTVYDMFEDHESFSFDSFVRFRMRPFMELLEQYVELSIDEYKMEQEYQMFIQMLQQFLSNRKPKLTELHLVMDEEIVFFNEQFYEITRAEIVRMMDRKLLSNHPIYVDSVTIAPLLSIAPATIYLYTNDREQPLVRTIQKIFEERVTLMEVDDFFQYKKTFP